MMRRLRRVPARVWDFLLAGALTLLTLVELARADDTSLPLWAGAIALTGAIAFRRTHPFGASAVWLAGITGMVVFGTSPAAITAPFLTLFILPYAASQRLERRPALAVLGMVWIGVLLVYLADDDRVWGDLFFPGMFATGFWAAGRLVRSRSRLTAELHEAAVRAAEAQEAATERAAAEERRRIAREMHDVVAHSVSMMVVQAGGARRILDRDPQRAVAAAELIERTGREALTEMRRLLGVFHADDEAAAYEPQPSLREVATLVERARAAGVPVTLDVAGTRPELPAGVDLAAYRVVQEALTNVVKHSGGAATDVRVRYGPAAVEVTVVDRGGGAMETRLDGGGHGLAGMRERVRVYGGELHAGRRRGGGFEVRALLPLQSEDEAALVAGAKS